MPYPWTAHDILTAADLNAAIATAIVSTGLGAWTAFTPTWSGTIGNGTLDCKYTKIGRTIVARYVLTWGSTTSHPAAAQTFTLPVAAAVALQGCGTARIVDQSASANFSRAVYMNTTNQLAIVSEAGAFVTNLVPMTWAVSDILAFTVTYESAT